MDAQAFLRTLGSSFLSLSNDLPRKGGATAWTRFMTKCIVDMADRAGMHVCSEHLPRLTGGPHERREYQYDFTLFATDEWDAYSLPSVIIEHENSWSRAALFHDFWKVLTGFAPLRVMFGYASSPTTLLDRAGHTFHHGQDCRWRYPECTEDLVLLRHPAMQWPRWRILYRTDQVLHDLGMVSVDGSLVPLASRER